MTIEKHRNEHKQEKRRKKMKGKIYAQLYSILKTNQKRSLEALRQLSKIGYDGVELMGTNTCGMSNDEYKKLIQNTDPDYVNFELDCGWCAFSGCDPTEYVRKYPGRFPLVHVKEALRTAYCDDELEHFPKDVLKIGMPVGPVNPKAAKEGFLADINLFTEEQASIMYWSRHWNGRLGDGIIDWKALSDALEAQGVEAYICEREYYSYEGGGTAYICAQQDYEYLKQLLGQ